MFAKKKNFRRRTEDDDASEATAAAAAAADAAPGVAAPSTSAPSKPSAAAAAAASKKEKPKERARGAMAGPSLLSFGGEEDGEESVLLMKPKKKSGSTTGGLLPAGPALGLASGAGLSRGSGHSVKKGLKQDSAPGVVAGPSNIQAQAGEYTKERLAELAKNTIRIGATGGAKKTPPPESSSGAVVVLKGMLKPAGASEADQDRRSGGTAPAGAGLGFSAGQAGLGARAEVPSTGGLGLGFGGEAEAGGALGARGAAPGGGGGAGVGDMESRLGLLGIGFGADAGGITHIPDARDIAAAKAKRERLRQAQAAPDYIPVTGGGAGGKYGESRLVREQDDDLDEKEGAGGGGGGGESSGDEEEHMNGRMAFVGLVPPGGAAQGREKNRTKGAAAAGAGLGAGASNRRDRRGARAGRSSERGPEASGGGPGGSGLAATEAAFSSAAEKGTIVGQDPPPEPSGGNEEAMTEEEDEEARRWEEEQLRKGVGKRVEEPGAAAKNGASAGRGGVASGGSGVAYGLGGGLAAGQVATAGWGYGARHAGGAEGGAYSEAHAKAKREQEGLEEKFVQTADTVLALERALEASSGKYRFVQELRDYIALLCDFLRDKAPIIEELEEHMQHLRVERAAAKSGRRVDDTADELAEAEAAMSAAMSAMSRKAGAAAVAAAAQAASEKVREGEAVAPEYDEFGRDVNLQKRMQKQKRAQARERRQAKSAAARGQRAASAAAAAVSGSTTAVVSRANGSPADGSAKASERMEGESSSDESESEERAYEAGRSEPHVMWSRHLEAPGGVFGDAAEEYSKLGKVKERLEVWKRRYPGAYRDAYVALTAPAMFAPYVRLELLHWDPLFGTAGFDDMSWYNTLFDYGMPAGAAAEEPDPDDPDANLVPKLVEKVALPALHADVAHCWDPLSTAGTRRAVAAVQEVLIYVAADSEALRELLAGVRTRLIQAVTAAQVPAWTPTVLAAVPSAARFAAVRFAVAVRLLRNIAMWRDVVAPSVLNQLALEELLTNRVLPHLRSIVPAIHDALARTERLVDALSSVWVGPGLGGGSLSPKLAPFVTYLDSLGKSLESRLKSGRQQDDVEALARRLKRMFVNLNEYDKARALVKAFSLKEAI
eukprot:jgi/Mesen1/3937/ME000209S02941